MLNIPATAIYYQSFMRAKVPRSHVHRPPTQRLTLFFLLAYFIAQSSSFILSQDWPLIRGDAAMTGVSPTKLVFPLMLAWSVKVGDKTKKEGVVATPVVKNGKAFIGAQNGKFVCLDLTTGKEIWHAEKKGFFDSSAAFAGDLVIAGCGDSFVYAWNAATGNPAWKFETQGEIHAGVNVWTDAKGKALIFIGSYDNSLYCLDAASGQKIWAYETSNYVNGASAIFNNQVVFGGCDGTLYALDCATGKEMNKIDVGSYIGNNIAVDKGIAFVAHYGNKVEAFNFADGKQLWSYNDRDFPYYAAPAVNAQFVITGCRDKRVRCLSREKGEEKWQFRTRGDVDSSPVICGDAHVLFGSNDGNVYAVDLAKGEEAWHYEIGAAVKSAPAVAGAFILFGADDGSVYCFKNGDNSAKK